LQALERRRKRRRPVSDEEHVELERRIWGDTVADAMLELRRRTGRWPGQFKYNDLLTLSVGEDKSNSRKTAGRGGAPTE
jgi:hypothetical protein